MPKIKAIRETRSEAGASVYSCAADKDVCYYGHDEGDWDIFGSAGFKANIVVVPEGS